MQAINFISIHVLQAQAAQNTKPSSQEPAFPARSSFKPSGKPIAALCRAGAEGLRKTIRAMSYPQSSFQRENRFFHLKAFEARFGS